MINDGLLAWCFIVLSYLSYFLLMSFECTEWLNVRRFLKCVRDNLFSDFHKPINRKEKITCLSIFLFSCFTFNFKFQYHKEMSALVGVWNLFSTDNFEEYMKEIGSLKNEIIIMNSFACHKSAFFCFLKKALVLQHERLVHPLSLQSTYHRRMVNGRLRLNRPLKIQK